jgi:hypothetical protein
MAISEWDLHGCTATMLPAACAWEKYTPRDMVLPCISEWDLGGAASYYQQLVPQGRNIHQGHGIPPCISKWDLQLQPLVPSSLYPGKYTPRAFLHVYQNGIYRGATSCLLAACTRRNIHPGTWHSSMYISEWDLVLPLATTSSLCQGEIYTQGHGIPPYIKWVLQRCDYYQQLVPQGEIYTQGHGIPPYIRMGSTRAATTTSSLCQEKYTPRDMAFLMYIVEWDIHPGPWRSLMYQMGSTRCCH